MLRLVQLSEVNNWLGFVWSDKHRHFKWNTITIYGACAILAT